MSSDLLKVKGIGPAIQKKLFSLDIYNVWDLINFLPTSYVDFDSVNSLNNASNGDYVVAHLEVLKIDPIYRKGKQSLSRVYCKDIFGEKKVKISWYNVKYIHKTIACGDSIVCFGKVSVDNLVHFVNPLFKTNKGPSNLEESFSGIKATYPTRGLISQGVFSKIVKKALDICPIISVVDEIGHEKYQLIQLEDAYRACHFPNNLAYVEEGKERIRLEETVRIICAFEVSRTQHLRGYFYNEDAMFLTRNANILPFTLTSSQKEVINALTKEMSHSPYPINSILVGDVGSGKTVVALFLAYFAAISGYQVAVIAPTAILASQHYETFLSILKKRNIRIALLTSAISLKEREKILNSLSKGEIAIIIGTHSLLSSEIDFKNLSLVITDEQHRFGVVQRTSLIKKGVACDLLSLSATPIPRSYHMMLLGNIKTYYIENRRDLSNLHTYIVPNRKLESMFSYVISKCRQGEQAFIVVPRIYDVEGQDCSSVEAIGEKFEKEYNSGLAITLLHGKMSPDKKEEALKDFMSKKTSILVSTSLIEVGIDMPSVSIMVIMEAERFGFASLHQLRGRIGRLGQHAECYLFVKDENAMNKLSILVEEKDGLKIAEKDYEERGAGSLFGISQSGEKSIFSKLSIEEVRKCLEISKEVDLFGHYPLLLDYSIRHGLENISLH